MQPPDLPVAVFCNMAKLRLLELPDRNGGHWFYVCIVVFGVSRAGGRRPVRRL